MEIIKKTTSFKAILSIFFLMGILLIPSVLGATSKSFSQDVSRDTREISEVPSQFKTNYGTYTIEKGYWFDVFNWFKQDTLREIDLEENTEVCSDDCMAIGNVNNLKEGKIFDSIKFKRSFDDGLTFVDWDGFTNWKLYIEEDVERFETICDEIIKEGQRETGNQTNQTEYDCHEESLGLFKEWKIYDFNKEYSIGNYKYKLTGSKKSQVVYDWILSSDGQKLENWAIWGSIGDGDEAEVILNSPLNNSIAMVNPVTFNATAIVTGGASLTNVSLCSNISGSWSCGDTIDIEPDIEEGLVSYYKLDETSGTTAFDSLGLNNGTNNGATINQAGKIDKAYSFDGVDDYITLGPATNFIGGKSSASVSVWIKPNSITTRKWVFGSDNGIHGGDTTISIYFYDDGKFRVNTRNAAGVESLIAVTSTSYFSTGTWAQIVAIYDGSNIKLYINGNYVAQNSLTGNINPSTNTLTIGRIGTYSTYYYKGLIDEVGIWNRALTPTEITELYNGGNGARLFKSGEATLTWNKTITGTTLWNVKACDSDGDCGFAPSNYTFSIDSTAPTIALNYPVLVNYAKLDDTLQLNFTATDTNLDKVWYNYNGTNISVTGALSGIANLSNITLSTKKNVTIYANDTAGNLNATTFSLDYKVFEEGITYKETVYETELAGFKANFSYDSTKFALFVKLNYGGVNYTATELSHGHFETPNFDIPLVNTTENKIFYWLITYQSLTNPEDKSTIETYYLTQQVIPISIGFCTAGNKTLEFKAYDEENKTQLNTWNFLGTFDYWIGSGELKKTVSIQNLSINSSALCISPSNLEIKTDAIIQYEKEEYAKRNYYFFKAKLTNETQNISLYLLKNIRATSFIVQVRDKSQLAVKDTYIYVQRYYPGTNTYDIVAMGKTDDAGNTVIHFEIDTEDYRIQVVKDGEVVYTSPVQKVYCTGSPCTLPISIGEGKVEGWKNFGDFENLVYIGPYYDKDSNEIVYTYIDTSGTTSYGRLLVYTMENNKKKVLCNVNSTSSAATLSCDVMDIEGTVYAEGYLSRSPEVLVWARQFIINTIKEIFGQEGLFWGMLIVMVMAIAGALIGGVGGGVIGTIGGMWGVQLIGIASFGMITIWGVTAIGIFILWNMRR